MDSFYQNLHEEMNRDIAVIRARYPKDQDYMRVIQAYNHAFAEIAEISVSNLFSNRSLFTQHSVKQ